jgi:hypothetical protein
VRSGEMTMKATDSKPLHSLMATAMAGVPGNDGIKRSLHAIRAYLGMDIAYVSEFVGDGIVLRQVDAPGLEGVIKVGDCHSTDDGYCDRILEGRLPQLIGKHVSVPIRLADGKVHGMFCCLGFKPDDSLGERDLQMMQVFADLAAFEIDTDLKAAVAVKEKEDRIRGVIDSRQLSIVYQPIWKLGNARPVGFECLARFAATPQRPPDRWFAEAGETGLGTELELTAIRLALGAATALPPDIYLAVNASPQTLLSEQLAAALNGIPPRQIVLEITEHAPIALAGSRRAPRGRRRRRGILHASAHPAAPAGPDQTGHEPDPEHQPGSGAPGAGFGAGGIRTRYRQLHHRRRRRDRVRTEHPSKHWRPESPGVFPGTSVVVR